MADPTLHDTFAGAPEPLNATIDSFAEGRPWEGNSLLFAIAQVAVGGAACGAFAGFAILATLVVVTPGASILAAVPVGVLFGATFGAAVGALLAPSLGFWLFRDIVLGRLYAYATAGTIAGGLLAPLARGDASIGAFAGLAAGLALVRLRTSRGS